MGLDIYRMDGVMGYTRGLSSFTMRVVAASSVQLSTYDMAKDGFVNNAGMQRSAMSTHVCASLVTGAAMAVAMQPFDFACTRLANSRTVAEGGGCTAATFTGPMDVIRKTVNTEGVVGVYRGLLPNYMRLAPYNILVFVFLEQLR